MKKFRTALCAVTLLLLSAAPIALAQAPATTTKPVTPLQLKPASSAPITIHMLDDARNIYLAIGKLAGLTVLFDPDYQSKKVQVDVTNVSLSDALRIVGEIAGAFYEPLTPDTIYVAANTHQKHTDLDELDDETIYLKNTSQAAEANEIVTALRNMLSAESKVFLVASENAIVFRTTPENLVRARKLLNDLDVPKKTYRLTYTVTEMDAGKRVGTQHFAMVIVSGQRSTLKQGSKVPIATGSYNATATTGDHPLGAGVQTQFTYLDIGMNFNATLQPMGSDSRLQFNVEQSSLAPETSGVGPQDPIVRQTSLQGEATLTPGKPTMLGSVDIPGSTRHLDIEVLMEPLP